MSMKDSIVNFVSILKICAERKDLYKGIRIHDDIVKRGLVQINPLLGSSLINMYAKCGDLTKAQKLLNELPFRDIVSWNSLISGFSQKGLVEDALNCLENLKREGFSPNAITFVCILKACGMSKKVHIGKQIHDEIVERGLLCGNIKLGNALVDMYAKCSDLVKAQQVLDEIPSRDIITWSSLISGYAQQQRGEDALNCFERMQSEGLSPNAITLTCVLKACASIRVLDKGKQIHDKIVSEGLLSRDLVLGTALVDMYARCGSFINAKNVLEELPSHDVVAWSALISGYTQQGHGREALECFNQMQQNGLTPDEVTFTCILKACGDIREIQKGKQVHEELIHNGLLKNNVVLGNALVDMYAKCGELSKAKQILSELPVRNVITWSALILRYAQQGHGEDALECFESMQKDGLSPNAITYACILKACGSPRVIEKGKKIHDEVMNKGMLTDVVIGTALVDMYARCGELKTARGVLDELPVHNIATWNALISGYAQIGQSEEALGCLETMMQREDPFPNAITFTCALKACSSMESIEKGKQIHEYLVCSKLLGNDIALHTALVDMYAKCGALAKAKEVFGQIPVRDVVSWNALISGYVQQGKGEEALDCLGMMKKDGVSPNSITFAYILKTCGDVGLVNKGRVIHDEIIQNGLLLQGDVMLATALVEMYARAGMLSKAEKVLDELLIQNVVSWNALMSGYAQQGQGKRAIECFEQMRRKGIQPTAVTFLCLLNACSHSGLVDEGQMYFENMSGIYGVSPHAEHHACMVDLLSRAGHFERAMAVIHKMPSSNYLPVWASVLGACRKWGNVELGRLAFKQAIQLDRNNVAAHICMINIFTAAGMQEEAQSINAMRIRNSGCKHSGVHDVGSNVHLLYLTDSKI